MGDVNVFFGQFPRKLHKIRISGSEGKNGYRTNECCELFLYPLDGAVSNMASANEAVLLKSTLEIQNKAYSVKLTASEIYWETITSARAASGPYSEPLVSEYFAYL